MDSKTYLKTISENEFFKGFKEYLYENYQYNLDFRRDVYLENEIGATPTYNFKTFEIIWNGYVEYIGKIGGKWMANCVYSYHDGINDFRERTLKSKLIEIADYSLINLK